MKSKKNKMIVFLCVALIFMGIGYAALQTNLNITGTSKASGTFNVQITDVDEDATSSAIGGVPAAKKSATHTQTTATISAEFSKPGDFVEYEVDVSNLGSIDAIIDVVVDDEVLASEEDGQGNKIYLLSVTPSARQELLVGETKTLLVKIEYNKNAQSFPESESVTFTVAVNATQKGTQTVEPLPVAESIWTIEEIEEVNGTKYGRIIGYNEQLGGTDIVVPYSVDGMVVKEIDGGTFISGEIEVYYDGDESFVAVVYAEGERYNTISAVLSNMGISLIYSSPNDVPSGYTKLGHYNYDDENETILEPTCNITTVDFSQAIGLEEIGGMAFYGAPLTSVNFGQNSNLQTIRMGAFYMTQLTSVNLPISLETIEDGAFCGSQLTGTLTIPSNVTSIGESAFYENQISGSLIIPSSVTSIGSSAFSYNQISTLNLSNATSLETIGNGAFSRNQLTGTLVIPSSVTSIGDSAFEGYDDESTNQLTGLNLSNATSLETIGRYAFRGNQISGTLTIPSSVTSIGESAFDGSYDGSTNQIITLNLNNATSLETIGRYAFRYNQLSGTLTIPSSVTSIGEGAFEGTSDGSTNQIITLNLNNATSLETIGYSAFRHNQISTLNLSNASNLEVIGDSAFRHNQISTLNLSNASNLEVIGDSAFCWNQISTLNLSGATSLETIGDYAFSYNQISGTLAIPASVTSIGAYAFEYNQLSGTLTIPSSVTSIGVSAFYDNKIEILNIGSGLTSLGLVAFGLQYDSSLEQNTLTTINIDMTQATWNSRNLLTSGWYDGTPTVTYNQS